MARQYNSLNDPADVNDERAFLKAKIVAKFCSFGIVSSAKWFSGYIVIFDGVLKLYDHEDTVKYSPASTILEIPLNQTRRPSAWKRKKYSQNNGVPTDFYSFYIMQNSEWLGTIRELKIGTHDLPTMEKILRCVEFNTRHEAGR